jgi:membrane protease subunit (stomatin/prohibitin family)
VSLPCCLLLLLLLSLELLAGCKHGTGLMEVSQQQQQQQQQQGQQQQQQGHGRGMSARCTHNFSRSRSSICSQERDLPVCPCIGGCQWAVVWTRPPWCWH